MNLSIDKTTCTCCGNCVKKCPGHVLSLSDEGRPYEKYPDDCWYCGVCQVECPAESIQVIFPYLIR